MAAAEHADRVVGRELELGELDRRLRACDGTAGGVVVVDGDPGIGKTTLLDWVAQRASDRPVVRLAASEVERDLAYGGLHALVTELDKVGAVVPAPHDAVLAACTGRGRTPGALAVGAATLAAITAREQLVVLVDDAQWLDTPTASALAFACRRLTDESTLVVIAERDGAGTAFDGPKVERWRLGGLSVTAAASLLRESPPDVVAACVASTAGNPLGLLELARGLTAEQLTGRVPLPSELPIGGRLVAAFAERIASLPVAARRALTYLAASTADDGAAVADSLAADGGSLADLVPAEAAGVVELSASGPRLTHPLYRPAIVDAVGRASVRAAHRALAEHSTDPDRRALHLAASVTGPDADAAAALAGSAATSAARGAPALAAELYERAASLTPDPAGRVHRQLDASRAWWDACDAPRALAAAARVLAASPSASVRAQASEIRGEATAWTVDNRAGAELLVDAARAEGVDAAVAATLLLRASLQSGLGARPVVGRALADEALALAPAGSPIEPAARAVRAMSAQRTGDRALADAELAAAAGLTTLSVADAVWALAPLQAIGLTLLQQERWREAAEVVDLVIASSRLHGHDSTTHFASALRGELAIRTGRPADALATPLLAPGDEGTPALVPHTFPFLLAVVARAEAVLGRHDAARAHAERARAVGLATGSRVLVAWADSALGHVALVEGRPDEAVTILGEVAERTDEVVDPGDLWFHGDLAEALIEVGDVGGARRLADRTGAAATRLGTVWGVAVADRVHGLLDRDVDRCRASVAALQSIGARFEMARSLLAAATVSGDPEMVARASATFSACGATRWATRAQALADVPLSTGDPVTAVTAVLSDAELRVAVLVAQGRSNRQVAADLVLSPRTVDAHLRSIYRKLGITSRSQLTATVVRQLG